MKHFTLLIFFTLFTTSLFGQKVDDEKLIDIIKQDVTNFFVKKGILSGNDIGNNLGYVYVNQIPEGQVLGYSKNGIYIIGVHQSHSEKHLLIKEDKTYIIYDLKEIYLALEAVMKYSQRNGINDDDMLKYLKLVIQKYEDNYNHEYSSISSKKQ